MIKVTIWNEFRHEQSKDEVRKIYPEGIHKCLANELRADDLQIRTATLDEPEHGLTEEVLNNTDVLIWWGHMAHHEVSDEVVKKVHRRILEGMGLIALHSAHFSKIFKAVLGTNCSLRWREANERERLWNLQPNHPITQGIGPYIVLEKEEMYGERFDIPEPDETLFISWFEGGEVFRSGCTWRRGQGKIFYFRPGHETYPTYKNPEIIKVIQNAIRWAKPFQFIPDECPNPKPLEPISKKD